MIGYVGFLRWIPNRSPQGTHGSPPSQDWSDHLGRPCLRRLGTRSGQSGLDARKTRLRSVCFLPESLPLSDTTQERREKTLKSLESEKHYLWHGNVARAHDRIQDIHCFLDNEELTGENSRKLKKGARRIRHVRRYQRGTHSKLRRALRNEEAIATGFVESAVNQIVSKRFAKKQQMQWTKKSAHLVLQRIRAGNARYANKLAPT